MKIVGSMHAIEHEYIAIGEHLVLSLKLRGL